MSSTRWSPRLWALLLMLSGNMLIDALEVSTVVVAMPSVARTFALRPAGASWLMTCFAIGFGGFILPGARLTARYGRRRLYLWALLTFAVASLVAGLAGDPSTLAVTRVVKGVCVALTAPTGLAIIGDAFPAGPPRNRALSVYSLFGASGFSAGLVLSGALSGVGWRWALAFAAPVALVLLLAGLRFIPADPVPEPPGGTSGPRAARAGLGFGWPAVRSAAGAAALNGSYWGFLLLVTFQTQARLGWSPLRTGLFLVPTSLPLALFAAFSGRVVSRYGPGRLIVGGGVAAVAGYAWYLAGDGRWSYLDRLVPATLLIGVAFMLSFSALHIQAVSDARPGRQPVVGRLYQTSVQLGGAATLVAVAAVAGSDPRSALVLITSVAAGGLLTAVAGLLPGHTITERRAHVREPHPGHGDHREPAGRPAGPAHRAVVRRSAGPAR